MRDGVEEINKVCKKILKLRDTDFAKAREEAQEQIGYINPIKMATTARQNELGKYNLKVIEAIEGLHKILIDGSNI